MTLVRRQDGRAIELVGWLSCDSVYDGRDEYAGEQVEIYEDARDLGEWRDLLVELAAFDGKRVRVLVEEVAADA